MSGPQRAFSFNQGGDQGSRHPGHSPDVSPIHPSIDEGPELSHGHPSSSSPYTQTSPVESPSAQHRWPLGPSQSGRPVSSATPGMDNLGPGAVGGGISGIALGIANSHDRLSGTDARRSLDELDDDGYIGPVERGYTTTGSDNPYVPPPPEMLGYASSDSLHAAARDSYGSNMALGAAPGPPGSDPSQHSLLHQSQGPSPYHSSGAMNDGPYQRNSAYEGPGMAINPDEIADDGDDGLMSPPRGRRSQPAMAAAGGAGAGGVFGAFGGLVKGKQPPNPSYDPVAGGSALEAGEKSRWGAKSKANGGSKKRGLLVGLVLAFIVVGAIVGGAVGGILGNREGEKDKTASSTGTAKEDKEANGDLDKDSSDIKKLLNNKDLHKVFPGVDYTPWGVQYPLCLKYPPSQNNVTRDMAVLSQLTNNVRLYGTDCNQTEMVLHAIDRLELKDMKLWLGVWIDTNKTTNDRQLKQLYKVLDDTKDTSIFNGAIIGNEALFRAGPNKQVAQKNLISYMEDVRKEMKKRDIDMPIATSDLGDNWNKALAEESDIVMSNVHPFFAGVTIEDAASWTWDFWQSHNVDLTKGTKKKNIISEVGWPSGGGNNCGSNGKCSSKTDGSVAGVDELNKFMSDWICQALDNGTNYFWYAYSSVGAVHQSNDAQVRSFRRALEN